ncbi:MAG: lytic murein transglycosylase B [Neisseria sp.]|uniref:lytic murein transglycosylase B n=1 Tax=Neisseria sp. TaxID=192066 RepID=UPI0026DA709A|nr:lytic murein transglycosylase B [Neisseria sp.]MDO4641220.1 lytic murein transglycosylase B [Neisseria sp.]
MKKNLFSTSIMLSALLLAACQSKEQPVQIFKGSAQAKPVKPIDKSKTFFNEAAPSPAVTGFNANPNVQKFIDYQVKQNHLNRAVLQNFFDAVIYRGNVISIMDRPGTSRPWYEFKQGNSGAAKINGGRQFYAENRNIIDDVASKYGVPAELIVAIIGIETNYGANKGNIRVADSLATLAFDYPRRGEFFQQELADFLAMAEEEKRDPMEFTGSFAGAMGMPQFMPSSFRKWAVDYDKDGRRDIWGNVGDVAASVANYMKVHGWQSGGKMVVPVALVPDDKLQTIIDEKTAMNRTVGELKKLGVTPLEAVSDNEKAVLYRLETSPGVYDYYIGLNNFYAVWQYNHSRMYVTSVRDIANGLGAGGL